MLDVYAHDGAVVLGLRRPARPADNEALAYPPETAASIGRQLLAAARSLGWTGEDTAALDHQPTTSRPAPTGPSPATPPARQHPPAAPVHPTSPGPDRYRPLPTDTDQEASRC